MRIVMLYKDRYVTCDTLGPPATQFDIFDSVTSEGKPRICSLLVPETRGIAFWGRLYWMRMESP